MLSLFKKKRVEKKLSEVILNNPLNYQLLENFQIEKATSITIHDSYYFSAHSLDRKQCIYFRLTNRKEYSEIWLYYIEGTHKYYLEEMIYTNTSPLKIFFEDNIWNIKFSGLLKKNSKEQVRCTLDLKFYSENEFVNYDSNTLVRNLSKAIIKEKCDDAYFEQLFNNKQNYYYQFGNLQGRMLLEGQHISINLPCYRDRTNGNEDFEYLNNHMKLIAINKEGYINFNMISNKSVSLLEIGNICINNITSSYIEKVIYERLLLLKGTAPDNLNMLMFTENQQEIDVHIKKLDEFKYSFNDGQYQITECIVEFLINGIIYRGILEVGFSNDKSNWFNGNEIEKLIK